MDPILNPIEMGLSSENELVQRLSEQTNIVDAFARAFPEMTSRPTVLETRQALAGFLRSLATYRSAYDRYLDDPKRFPLSSASMRGLALFVGRAGCSACHRITPSPARFSDDTFHHSSIGWGEIEKDLPILTSTVIHSDLEPRALAERIESDSHWAALGRFAITHRLSDLGAFRTPSLRNVALTGPYMHDGSVEKLADALNIEIYYRSLSTGKPLNLTQSDREALLAFLNSLTDAAPP